MRGMGGVRPLAQFMEDGSFLMPEVPAVLRALQAMGAPEWLDYDYAMSVSGAALRLTWQMGWAGYEDLPNQAEVFFNGRPHGVIETALTNLFGSAGSRAGNSRRPGSKAAGDPVSAGCVRDRAGL